MSHKHPASTAAAVRDLRRTGRDQREIARLLGVSKGYVSNVLREPHRAAPSRVAAPTLPTSAPVPTPAPSPADARRAALRAAWFEAETPAERAAIDVDLLRLEDTELDAALTRGAGLVVALSSGPHGPVLTALATPAAIAELAIYVHDDDPDTAAATLEAALAIVRRTP